VAGVPASVVTGGHRGRALYTGAGPGRSARAGVSARVAAVASRPVPHALWT